MRTNEFLNHFIRQKKNSPADWHVQCPGHDDGANPDKFSLHVTAKDDRLLICCMAGCETAAVLGALGLKEADLFYDHGVGVGAGGHGRGPTPAPAGWTQVAGSGAQQTREPAPAKEPEPDPIATLAAFSVLKRIPIEFLVAEGWRDTAKGIAIPYKQRDGSAWRVRGRTSLKPGAGFVWDGQKERPMIPYGRHRLDDAIDLGDLFLVEGESDTVTAWLHGLPCLGLPGNTQAKALSVEDLVGIATLWLIVEPGQSGEGFVKSTRSRLPDLAWQGTVKLVHLPAKDLNDLHVLHADNPEAFMKAVQAAQARAVDLPQADVPPKETATQAGHNTALTDDAAPVHLSVLLREMWDEIESGRKPIVVPTPFPVLNEMLDGGFAMGELTYIGARASVGKSAIALQFGTTAARYGHGVLIVSREMPNRLLARRIVAQEARVFGKALRRNTLEVYDKGLIKSKLPSLEALPIYLTNEAKGIDAIEQEVARFSGTAPLGLLIIDYVQLVGSAKGIKERRLQVENVSERLRDLAIEYNIAVIAISSLNRAGSSEDVRPTTTSLRESSELEFDADVILLLHREFGKRETECTVAKQRNGEQGVVHLLFQWEFTAFEEG